MDRRIPLLAEERMAVNYGDPEKRNRIQYRSFMANYLADR